MTLNKKEIEDYMNSIFLDSVDFSKPVSEKNMYIDIYHGWSDADETNESRFHMFSANFPSKGMFFTGIGGFIDMWDKFTPVKYNGQVIPIKQYDDFYKYCKHLNEEE